MKLLKYGYYVYQVAYTIGAEIYVYEIYTFCLQGLKKIYVRTSTIISSGSNTHVLLKYGITFWCSKYLEFDTPFKNIDTV